ncbi:MAG: hypothetical protein NZM43_02090 [Saprospiraceae bacterium]|nr:hypothetical protein [Saprospiraceae bacterium]MDW8483090.1 hypothetical protein [Saprospiraceae bacterium]
MKEKLWIMAAATLLTLSLSSCGEKLLTPEQVEAEIAKGVEAGKPKIEQEENAKCDAEFEARVTAEFERLKAEHEAQQTIQ